MSRVRTRVSNDDLLRCDINVFYKNPKEYSIRHIFT